jgi:transcriptional regulator with XRE-family HTH domain
MSDRQRRMERMRTVLSALVRTSGLKPTAIERQVGVSRGYMTRLLQGRSMLRVEHVLAVLEILGVDPSEFFALAFPPGGERSELVAQLEGIFGPGGPAVEAEPRRPAPRARQWTREEVHEIVTQTVTRVLEEMGEHGEPPSGRRGKGR